MGVYDASDGSEGKECCDKTASESSEGSEEKEGGHDNGPKGSDSSEGRENANNDSLSEPRLFRSGNPFRF